MIDEFSLDFQRHFVNHLLRDSDFLLTVKDDLSFDLFSDSTLQRIVRLVLDFVNEHKSAPNTMIFHYIDNLKSRNLLSTEVHTAISTLVDELYSYPLQNRSYILSTFVKFIRNQKFKNSLPAVIEYVKKGDFDKAEDRMNEVFSFKAKEQKDLGVEFSLDPSSRILRRIELPSQQLWTLIPPIDQRVSGLRGGELLVLQSQRSSAGKTIGLVQLTRNYLFQGKKVLVYVLEGSREAWEDRLDQCICGVTKNELTDYTKLTSKLNKLARTGGRLWIESSPMNITRVSDLKKHKEQIERTKGFVPDVIVIDYADLLAPETHSLRGDLYGTGSEVYASLVGWLQELDVPGVTAAQSGREAMNEITADQVHMSQSIAKVQIASVILSLNSTDREVADKKMRIGIVKNREGVARQTFLIDTDFARQQLWVRPQDEY